MLLSYFGDGQHHSSFNCHYVIWILLNHLHYYILDIFFSMFCSFNNNYSLNTTLNIVYHVFYDDG